MYSATYYLSLGKNVPKKEKNWGKLGKTDGGFAFSPVLNRLNLVRTGIAS